MKRHHLIAVLLVLCCLALAGCGMLGIATESYVEDRVEAVDEARIETAAAIVEPIEPIVPGITSYARERARGVVVREPPPADPMSDWMPLISLALTALGVPVSVGVTNHMRDKRRRQRAEAVTQAEAIDKGYHLEGGAMVPRPKA